MFEFWTVSFGRDFLVISPHFTANDNAPQFLQSTYTAQVPVNASKGFPIIKLSAKDADEGENARVAYKFLPVGAILFSIVIAFLFFD